MSGPFGPGGPIGPAPVLTISGLTRDDLDALLGITLLDWQWKVLTQLVGERSSS